MSFSSEIIKKDRLPILIQTVNSYAKEALLTAHQLKELSLDSFCDIYISIDDESERLPVPPGVNLIKRGSCDCWSNDLEESLAKLNSKYVLLWLDDLVPTAIDQKRLQSIWKWFKCVKGDYIRLNPTPRGGGSEVHDKVRVIETGESYRTSTILAIWNVAFLRSILVSGESAWQFEFFGSVRSDISKAFYACENNTVNSVNLVIKGHIMPSAEKKLNELGIYTGMLDRHRMSNLQQIKFNLIRLRSKIFEFIPTKLRRRLRLLFNTDLKLES